MTKKFKVCLTGGIASGKTYVSNKLEELGAHIIDADILARKVVKKGSIGLSQLINEFGSEILQENGHLDRSKLKQSVFASDEKLLKLNNILHPMIRDAFEVESNNNLIPLEIWVIPLYDGKQPYQEFDRFLVVDVPQDIQVKRIQKRDGATQDLAHKIIQSQPSREQRIDSATDVIVNRYSFEKLDLNIIQIHQLYCNLI